MLAPSRPAPSPSMGTALTAASRGSSRSAAANPTLPRTMLIRKIGRQVRPAMLALMMKPARIGPSTAEAPMTGPNALTAPRSCSRENAPIRMPMPCGISSAPKPPWTSRLAISMAGSADSPQASEASVNPAMPIRNIRRLPYRSPSRPPTTSRTPMARA